MFVAEGQSTLAGVSELRGQIQLLLASFEGTGPLLDSVFPLVRMFGGWKMKSTQVHSAGSTKLNGHF